MLFNRSFVLLWQGQSLSHLGNQAFLIATAYAILEATGSAKLVAAVMVASTAPLVLISPIGGVLADRRSRRTILVVTDLIRAVSVGALGLLLLLQPAITEGHLIAIFGVAAVSGAMAAFFSPAAQAVIPDLVPADRLAAANSAMQVSAQSSALVGQAAGGLLYVAWGAAGLLLFDAATFAYGALATSLIAQEPVARTGRLALRDAFTRYATDTREGLSYVRRRVGLVAVVGTFTAVNLLFMPVFVLLPLYVQRVLMSGPEWYGFLLAGAGCGALAGSAFGGLVLPKVSGRAALVRLSVAGVGACVLLLAVAGSPWVALAALAGIGALSSVINVTVVTRLQASVSPEFRGRVMSVVVALGSAAVPAGLALGGIAGDVWPDGLPAVFAACGAAIVFVGFVSARRNGFRELLDVDVRLLDTIHSGGSL